MPLCLVSETPFQAASDWTHTELWVLCGLPLVLHFHLESPPLAFLYCLLQPHCFIVPMHDISAPSSASSRHLPRWEVPGLLGAFEALVTNFQNKTLKTSKKLIYDSTKINLCMWSEPTSIIVYLNSLFGRFCLFFFCVSKNSLFINRIKIIKLKKASQSVLYACYPQFCQMDSTWLQSHRAGYLTCLMFDDIYVVFMYFCPQKSCGGRVAHVCPGVPQISDWRSVPLPVPALTCVFLLPLVGMFLL